MKRRAGDGSLAMVIAETAALGCLQLGPSRHLLIALSLVAAVLWCATWAFRENKARLGRVLRAGLFVPLPVLFFGESVARVSSAHAAWTKWALTLPILAWLMVTSVRISREADRRQQSVLSVTWNLFAFVLLPAAWLLVLLLLHIDYVFWLALVATGYGALVLRFGLGIATAIAWCPRPTRKNRKARAECGGAMQCESPLGIETS